VLSLAHGRLITITIATRVTRALKSRQTDARPSRPLRCSRCFVHSRLATGFVSNKSGLSTQHYRLQFQRHGPTLKAPSHRRDWTQLHPELDVGESCPSCYGGQHFPLPNSPQSFPCTTGSGERFSSGLGVGRSAKPHGQCRQGAHIASARRWINHLGSATPDLRLPSQP